MSTVTALCPNGRRQQVKVEANTKILQILEEVCKKQGLNCDEYDLVHQKRHLDVTLTFRLSGLPNNSQLELKKLDVPRKLNDVVLVLQLEEGLRLPQQSFKPTETLLNVLNRFKDAEDKLSVIPEVAVDPEDTIEPVCAYLHEEVVGNFQLENTQLKDLGLTGGRAIIRFSYRKFVNTQLEKLNSDFNVKLKKRHQIDEKYQAQQQQQQQQETSVAANQEAIASPVVEQQRDFKRPKQDEDVQQHHLPHVHLTRSVVVSEEMSAAFSDAPMLNTEFINFKFPEQTKGMDVNNADELSEFEKISKEPCHRATLVYNSEVVQSTVAQLNDDASDDFYDVTIHDLRLMIGDLQRQTSEDAPLMTKAMRELDEDKKAMKYEQIVIRIRFQNKLILQGLFRPKEPVSRLYEFIRESVVFTDGEADFYLYTTPPKVVLNDKKKTLFECKLCPAAIVHFGNNSGESPSFKPDLLSNLKTIEEANEVVTQNVHQRMRDITDEGLEYLEKERKLMQGLVKSTGITSAHVNSAIASTTQSGVRKSTNDATKEKLGRFLGSKK